MRVLRCIRSLDPSLGGTVEAVRQACWGLPELGHSVEVVCLDEPGSPWLRDFPSKVHALGPAIGTYGYSRKFVPWMREHAGEYDAVVVDGIWQFPSWGAWLALRKSRVPYFVYTHGMLSPWFKQTYPLKHLKKLVYWMLAEYWVLKDAHAVLYACEQERVQARESFWLYRATEAVTVPGIQGPAGDSNEQLQLFLDEFPNLRSKRLVLFVGRIHPVKGCDLLLEAFVRVSRVNPLLHLVFVGPDQTGQRRNLEQRVTKLGMEDRVTWTGALSGDAKWGAYRAAEVFALPSHTENFGLVVAEAMACGVPVLISDKVNIWIEVQKTGGGIVASDDLKGATELLEKWLAMTPEKRKNMAHRAREGFEEKFSLHSSLVRLDLVIGRHSATDRYGNVT
jgi:glycosyltransferase involved in cell wall biosynthesis